MNRREQPEARPARSPGAPAADAPAPAHAVLALQRAAGNQATARLLQRLPLKTRYVFPSAEARTPWFILMRKHLRDEIKPQIDEVEADDKAPTPQYGHEWKRTVTVLYERLWRELKLDHDARQREAEAMLIDLESQLGEHGVAAAMARQRAEALSVGIAELDSELAGTPAPAPGRVVTPLAGPQARLTEFGAGLRDPAPATRTAAIKTAREGGQAPYAGPMGEIPAEYILEERRALLGLVLQLGDVDAMFSLERGGSFVADALLRLMARLPPSQRRPITNVPVAKPTPGQVREYADAHPAEAAKLQEEGTNAHAKEGEEGLKAWAGRQRQVHAELMKAQILQYVARSEQKDITIAIAETAVSGSSVNFLITTLKDLTRKLRQIGGKKVRFKILGLREMIKKSPGYRGEGMVKVQDPQRLLEEEARATAKPSKEKAESKKEDDKDKGGIKRFPDELETEDLDQIAIYLSQTQYLVGEDVDFQMARSGPDSQRPVIVFDAAQNAVRAVQITPAAAPDSARNVLLDLIAGAYDDVITRLLAEARQAQVKQ